MDQITKWWVMRNIFLHEDRVIVPGFFNITHVLNDGVAFGLFQGRNFLFILVAIGILAAGLWWARKLDWRKMEINIIGALLVSGAVGNLIDRIRIGHVIDFLDFHFREFYHWPSFNIADSCITVSVIYVFLRILFSREHKKSI